MTSYEKTGVSIKAGNIVEEKISQIVKKTFNKKVLLGIGSFSGALSLQEIKKFKHPVLMATIDGVGTKTKIAALTNNWFSVGQDIVNHCSNDLLCSGARPLFFVDYIASSKINPQTVAQIIKGMAFECKKLDCPLIGGETAEMPQVYLEKETDIAGCMTGIAEKKQLFKPDKIKKNNALIGLASNGLHTNGYSLARKVLLEKFSINQKIKGLTHSIGQELLRPHKSYSKKIFLLMKKIKVLGIAHITGGGLVENIPRILPKNRSFLLFEKSWPVSKIFQLIQQQGKISDFEMLRTFNNGIGLVLAVKKNDAKKTLKELKKLKEKAFIIGKIT